MFHRPRMQVIPNIEPRVTRASSAAKDAASKVVVRKGKAHKARR